jgi:hypothetical protein
LKLARLLVSLGLLLAACKASPGSSCGPTEARCLDDRRALVCDDGKFIETPCRGKGGCSTKDQKTSCDISANQPGDPCSSADQGVAVCSSASAMLACHARRFENVLCRGPNGCEMVGEQPHCDQSIAEAGEACAKDGAKACSIDKTRVLACSGGRLSELYLCRGEAQCSASAGKVSCDQTVARLGDRCDPALSGHIACSEDKKALLACKDARFALSEKCKRGTRCNVSGQTTSCERP